MFPIFSVVQEARLNVNRASPFALCRPGKLRLDDSEHEFYAAFIRTNVLPRRRLMFGGLLLVFWFCLVCVILLRQQWSGEISGRDA